MKRSYAMKKDDDDIVIVSALRTPMCRSRKGGLANVLPSTLFQTVLEATLQATQLPPRDVEDIVVGNVLMPPSGFAALRMAQIISGIPETTSLQTVNRQCASGLQAVANVANSIAANEIQIGIGAGVESMSLYPMNTIKPPQVDWETMQTSRTAMDCLLPMGITSETIVRKYGLKREDLDAFAVTSHKKASAAQRSGKFSAEIVPVGDISQDDGIRPDADSATLARLKPAFSKSGVTTAGNSSQTTDGAAAVVLMKRKEAQRRGLKIMGVWRGYATAGVPPQIMGIGPAVAIPKVLELTGLSKSDIDLFEINEAFASQATWCVDELGLDWDKVNPNGGAIALGHPLGCTGARMVATLLHELHRRKRRYGVISMCIGTGMGAAAIIEAEPSSSL
jgi:acetyl-CoA acyltransferase 1